MVLDFKFTKKYISNYLLGLIIGVIIITIPTFIFNNIIVVDLDIYDITGQDFIDVVILSFINSMIIGTIPFLLIFYFKDYKRRKTVQIKKLILYYIMFMLGMTTNYIILITISIFIAFRDGLGFF